MDNTLNLQRFSNMKEEALEVHNLQKGQMLVPVGALKVALDKAVRPKEFKEIWMDVLKYGLGRKDRKDLKEYASQDAQYLQRLLVDLIDFSNHTTGMKFENGRWA